MEPLLYMGQSTLLPVKSCGRFCCSKVLRPVCACWWQL